MKKSLAICLSNLENYVLDMDGTLLDLHFDDTVWNSRLPYHYAKKNNCSLERAHGHIKSTLERSRGSLDWYSFPHWKNKLDIDISSIEMEVLHLVSVKKDTLRFLTNAKQRQKRLILATNAYPVSLKKKLAITGIDKYFDHILSAHEIGHAKEDTGFWNARSGKLSLRKTRTLIIDDNLDVLRAASKFGYPALCAISYPNSKGNKKNTEEFLGLTSLNELI